MFLVSVNIVNFVSNTHNKMTCFDPYKKFQHIILVLEKLKFI